jgi:glyoxylase-like metal-dependent hydrolase (beta-lactamase superfamily II)
VKTILIPAGNPGPYTGLRGNNTWLLPGRVAVLVDAGVGEVQHIEAVARTLGQAPLDCVLVTHAHSDHATGAPALAARWPGARLAKMWWPERDGRYAVKWHALTDAERIPAGEGTLVSIHTPGHAPDHLCFFDEAGGTLFSGDLLVAGGSVVIPGGRGGDLAAYLRSLERIRSLRPARVLPAHGPEITDVDALIDRYVEHRLEREQQVIEGLRGGCQDVAALVERIYADLHPALRDAAHQTVLAHLLKLESEGRAIRTGEQWYPR